MLTFNEDKKLSKLLENLIFHAEASHGNDTYMYSTQNQNTIDEYMYMCVTSNPRLLCFMLVTTAVG